MEVRTTNLNFRNIIACYSCSTYLPVRARAPPLAARPARAPVPCLFPSFTLPLPSRVCAAVCTMAACAPHPDAAAGVPRAAQETPGRTAYHIRVQTYAFPSAAASRCPGGGHGEGALEDGGHGGGAERRAWSLSQQVEQFAAKKLLGNVREGELVLNAWMDQLEAACRRGRCATAGTGSGTGPAADSLSGPRHEPRGGQETGLGWCGGAGAGGGGGEGGGGGGGGSGGGARVGAGIRPDNFLCEILLQGKTATSST